MDPRSATRIDVAGECIVVLSAVVALVLAADTRLAVMDFVSVNVDPGMVSFCSQTYASRVGQGGRVAVTTQQDIATLLGFERQKQLLGCDTSGSCIAELAGALGVEAVARGQIARLAGQFMLTIRVVDSRGQVLAALTAEGAEDKLPEIIARLAEQTRARLLTGGSGFNPAAVEASPASGGGESWAPWVPMGAGAVGIAAGATFLGLAFDNYRKMTAPAATFDDATAIGLRNTGESQQRLGFILAGAGAAVLAGGAAWKLAARKPSQVGVSLVPTSNGALVTFGGVLP